MLLLLLLVFILLTFLFLHFSLLRLGSSRDTLDSLASSSDKCFLLELCFSLCLISFSPFSFSPLDSWTPGPLDLFLLLLDLLLQTSLTGETRITTTPTTTSRLRYILLLIRSPTAILVASPVASSCSSLRIPTRHQESRICLPRVHLQGRSREGLKEESIEWSRKR